MDPILCSKTQLHKSCPTYTLITPTSVPTTANQRRFVASPTSLSLSRSLLRRCSGGHRCFSTHLPVNVSGNSICHCSRSLHSLCTSPGNYMPGYDFARFIAADESGVELVPRSVPVRVAHELLQAGHRYLDVRTVDEFCTGHPVGATNIPYKFKVGSGMTMNPEFLEQVSSIFGKDDEIIIGCQSGRWSLMAAAGLTSAGFTGVTDIAGGYLAWIQNRLPLEQ